MATAPPAKRLRTGGHRQRLDQQRAENAPQEGSEALKDADSQNRDLSKLRQLAAAGTNGQHQHKCYADVMKVAAPDNRLPSAFLQRLPFKAPLQTLLQAFLLPHMLFSAIYHSYPDTWRQCICPDAKRVEEFWRSVEGSPCVVAAIKAKRNFRQRLIPLALHGDVVPVTGLGKGWVQTVTNFSWYSLLTRAASTADSLFFIWAMFDKLQKRARDASGTAHRFFMLKDADSQNRDLSKLRQLAAAGTNGQRQHKCYADVMKVAAPDNRLPSAFLQRLPFKAPLQTLLQAFLLPHMLFSAIG